MQHADSTLQDIVDSLATRLARSVAIDDPQLRLLAASQHFGDEDPVRITSLLHREVGSANVDYLLAHGIAGWSGPGRVPPHVELGARGRLCVPVRCHGLLLGYLWLIDPADDVAERHVTEAVRAANAAGVVLYRRLMLHEREQGRGAEVLLDLLSRDRQVRDGATVVVRDERLLPAPGEVVVLVAALHPDTAQRQVVLPAAAQHALRPLPPGAALVHAAGCRLTMLLSHEHVFPQTDAPELAHRLLARVAELTGDDTGCFIGVGSTQLELAGAAMSHRHALGAERVARAVPGEGPVAVWDRLGAYALLTRIASDGVTPETCPAPVARLLDSPDTVDLLGTLETYLDLAGDAQRAAAALRIHRSTLYYRLNRAEQIAGVDLRDGRDRLTVHLGVKLARLAGWVGDADHSAFRQL